MGWLINKSQVRERLRELKPGVSVESTYFAALDDKVDELVKKHVFILKGKKRLNQYHVRCAGAFSGPPNNGGRSG